MALADYRRRQLEANDVRELYHLTAITNLPGILRDGLFPRQHGHAFDDIGDAQIVGHRKVRSISLARDHFRSLDEVALLFFTPLTPMTYRVVRHDRGIDAMCILAINPQQLCADDLTLAISDGNLAVPRTRYFYDLAKLDHLDWTAIRSVDWPGDAEAKRRRSAEFVVDPYVPTHAITAVLTGSVSAAVAARQSVAGCGRVVPVVLMPSAFWEAPSPHPFGLAPIV